MNLPPVITIDGPCGSGKGTISQLLAQKLGWHLLESGALYRVLALASQKNHIALDDEAALERLAIDLKVEFRIAAEDGVVQVFLEGEEITGLIRTEDIGCVASKISAFVKVRQALLEMQRELRQNPGLVADGRDMGTVVFPDANVKIFLIADLEERAKRRQKQLLENGIDVKLAALIEELAARDARDQQRTASPLKPADDAIVVDTTDLNIEEVVAKIWDIMDFRIKEQGLGIED